MRNKLKTLPLEFRKFLKTTSLFSERLGFQSYIVGGVVRDLLLSKAVFDLDITVLGDAIKLSEEMSIHFNANLRKYPAFGTASVFYKCHKIDFTTARSEVYSHRGALPKVKPSGLKDDLFRRDFTINAMAISLNSGNYGKLVDFHGGFSDLKKGTIRVLHNESFLDDPTRILRAIRFEQRFNFKIEHRTFTLMKEANSLEALGLIHPHRLRDEIILILKEPMPLDCIKRIDKLNGLFFLDARIKLAKDDYALLSRIKKTLLWYEEKFPKHLRIEGWLLYLGALSVKLSKKNMAYFFQRFDLKKNERIRLLSMKTSKSKINGLNKTVLPHRVYRTLKGLSLEAILFFYACCPDKRIRNNIDRYLGKLVHARLLTKGHDLKAIGVTHTKIYSKIMGKLLDTKIDKGFRTKKQELKAAQCIYKRLLKIKKYAGS
ncbi:MAG: hypothetical protein ABH872_01650 [Candidatus Omnitrophota bacterium]